MMGEDGDLQVRSVAELAAGDEIEAWHRGRLAHRGRVSRTLEDINLFWIIDARTGARRLLDLEQLSVRRVPAGRPTAVVGNPGPPAGQQEPALPRPGPGAWRQVAFVEAG